MLLSLIAGALALLWFPFAPKYLYDFDSANFALSLTKFDPALHRPQPPGYPLYVGLIRLIHLFVPAPEMVLLISGLLGAIVAVFLIWMLGERMFGAKAGLIAALLLLVNPVLWKAGLTAQVRVYFAVITLAVGLLAWEAWNAKASRSAFYAGFFVLGLGAGFRPTSVVVLLPLLVATGLRRRMRLVEFLLGFTALAVGVAPWLGVILITDGGVTGYYNVLRAYMQDQAHGSSVIWGADLSAAWRMVSDLVAWTGLGVLSWVWAMPLVPWRRPAEKWRHTVPFLLIWFGPAFLFLAVVHSGAPGHTLVTIPVLCLLGGWVLSSLSSHRQSWIRTVAWPILLVALALNVWWFFRPFSPVTRESSYKTVKSINRYNVSTIEAIEPLRQQGPLFLITHEAPVSWRLLSYYFSDFPLLVLHTGADFAGKPPDPWALKNTLWADQQFTADKIVLPTCGRIVWVLPYGSTFRKMLPRFEDYQERGWVLSFKAEPGMDFRLGPYHFVSSPEACGDNR